MHCNAITASCADPRLAPSQKTRAPQNEIAAQFQALLLQSALKPLADSLGFYGEVLTGSLAAGIARALERRIP